LPHEHLEALDDPVTAMTVRYGISWTLIPCLRHLLLLLLAPTK